VLELLSAIAKGLGYAAALSGAGIVLQRASLFRGLPPVPHQREMVRSAGAVLALCACVSVVTFLLRLGGGLPSEVVQAVALSPLGVALALQFVGALWLLAMADRPVALAGALLILLAFGVVGHSASQGVMSSTTVVVHVSAAAWWLGGLWMLLMAAREPAHETFPSLLARFSKAATWVVALLIVGGLFTAAQLLGLSIDAHRAYDQGLLAKAALTVSLLALAALNRLVLSPRVAGQGRGLRWLRRSIVAELVLIGGALCVTAWLTTWHSPHEAAHVEHGARSDERIRVTGAWAPATPGGVVSGAGYMVIVNTEAVDDHLVSARSPWAEKVSPCSSTIVDGVSRMREVVSLQIPAGEQIALTPGTYHLMFTGLYAPFVAGDVVPVTLVFERAGEVEVSLEVRPVGGAPEHEH
jgi:copper transport protein